MKLSPAQSLLLLTLVASALLVGGLAWAFLQMAGISRGMEQETRLGRLVMQLQVVQNEVAAARQLLNPTFSQDNGGTAPLAVATSRLQFADGVLQGLESQATARLFDAAERQSLADLLAMSGNLAGNKQFPIGAGVSVTQLAGFQQALGRFAARLGRQGQVEAQRNAHLRARARWGIATFAAGGTVLLLLLCAYLIAGWRRQYARLRQWLQDAVAGTPRKNGVGPSRGGLDALAGDLDGLEQRMAHMQEAALQHVLAVEEAAAKLIGMAGRWEESLSAGELQEMSAPTEAEDLDKLAHGLQALARGLQGGSDRLRDMQQAISNELPERRFGHPDGTGLAPRLAMAGEKVEQLLLLCLNLRLSLLHGQVEVSHFAAVADELDPVCAEGIVLAQDIAAAGASLGDAALPGGVGATLESGGDLRQALARLREWLARQAQGARAMADMCVRLREQASAGPGEGVRPMEAAARGAEIQAVVGDLRDRLHKLRTAGAR